MRSIFLILPLFAFLLSCEDPIDIPSQFESPQLVVDAWLTNEAKPQTIVLSETVPYFEAGVPQMVENATVQVCRATGSRCFTFAHEGGGNYVWRPQNETFGTVGDDFTLEISVEDLNFTGATSITRTARIDSISLEFEEESLQFDEGFYAQLYAFDSVGRGDTYWVRTYRNDTLLNRPSEVVTAFDATFDNGADIDGTYFISPLRSNAANSRDDDGNDVPYISGDRIYIEVHSISNTAFNFLQIALEQIQNEGIFAVPVANSIGNVSNTTTNELVLGIFNIAEVNSMERIVD
jgi:hypothetical protein